MTFDGFSLPTRNYFPMPNVWIDICAEITNLAELKVIQYVLRHTWGYREYGVKKAITTDEFMHGRKHSDGSRMDKGTGLSNRSVIDGLRSAVEHGYLEFALDETDKARKVKSYALHMQSADETDVKVLHIETDEPDVKVLHSGYEDVSHQREGSSHQREGSSHRSEKDTIEKHYRKTPKKDNDGAAIASHTSHAPLSEEKGKDVTQVSPPRRSGEKEKHAKTRKDTTPPKPVVEKVTLSQEEQAFYDLYCSMPWIKMAPKINEQNKEYCAKYARIFQTQEQLLSLRRYMDKDKFLKGKGFSFPLMEMAVNGWAMSQEQEDVSTTSKKPSPISEEEKQEKRKKAEAIKAALRADLQASNAQQMAMGGIR